MQDSKVGKKPLVIGIAGGTASGKSTICKALEKQLTGFKTVIIQSDFYYKKILPKIISPKSGIEYDDYNHPDSLDKEEFFKVVYTRLNEDWDVILIDSLFTLYYEETKNVSDLKIFIDLPCDERLIRRINRNTDYGLTYDEIVAYYLDTVVYRHSEFVEPTKRYADIIINGNYGKTALEVITSWVKGRIG